MQHGADYAAWNHTAQLMALLVTLDHPKKKAADPRRFHPYLASQARGVPITPENIHDLRSMSKRVRKIKVPKKKG